MTDRLPARTLCPLSTELVLNDILDGHLTAAVEGGSNYWAYFVRPLPTGLNYTSIEVCENDAHGDAPAFRGRIGLADLCRAIDLLWLHRDDPSWPNARRFFSDACHDDGHGDAETGDVLLQLACFGEIIYG